MAVPHIEEYRTDTGSGGHEDRIRRLEQYVAELSRELLYVLAHLDDGNLDPLYRAELADKLKRRDNND